MADKKMGQDGLANVIEVLKLVYDVFFELGYGFLKGTMPVFTLSLMGAGLFVTVMFNFDYLLWERLDLMRFYPEHRISSKVYGVLMVSSGFLGWAFIQVALRRRLVRKLTQVFAESGLKTALGRFPAFIFDRAIDKEARRMRLARSGLPLKKFREAIPSIESGLQVYVDDVQEQRAKGTVDYIYSHREMPKVFPFSDTSRIEKSHFLIGTTRASVLKASLRDIPHILVGGQTGGGKSTFLRQFITTLYVNNPDYQFTLIDLKEGLEFQLFQDLPRVRVISNASDAVHALESLENSMNERMKLLASAKVKDLEGLRNLPKNEEGDYCKRPAPKSLGRKIIVVDEVAELFLAGGPLSSADSKRAKEIVGRISRLGRAPGFHLVLATQRPDRRALDTQIKANLPGKIAFPMSDAASSMVLLGNARARDLPGVPGRAIWQQGLSMSEIQTPYLSIEEAEKILLPYREKDTEPQQPQMKSQTSNTIERAKVD